MAATEMTGGSQPGTQLSLVSAAANARLSELLRDAFALVREGVVTLLSGLAHRDRVDLRRSKIPATSATRLDDGHPQAEALLALPERGAKM